MTEGPVLLVGADDALAAPLREAGSVVTAVDDVSAALSRLDGHDCVVAAAELGERTGFDLSSSVAERDPFLPTVVVGERPLSAVAERAMDADVERYLQRPDDGAAPPDLTETVTAAAERYRERRRRAATAVPSPDGTCVVRDGTVVSADATFRRLFDVAGPVDRPLADLVVESDREDVEAALDSAAAEPVRVAPPADDGTTLELRVTEAPPADSLVVTVRDVTERADREAELREDSRMLDSLLENVPLSIYFKDTRSRHERVSRYISGEDPDDYIRNAEGKVHPHPDDVIGKTDYDLYAADFADDVLADDRHVIEQGEPIVNRIEKGTTNLGEELYTSTTKAPRYDEDGEVVGLVGVTIDVTDRIKHRQELERQNERLDEFAEVLTHDLRNPLQIAKGHVETIREDREDKHVRECSDALDRMESLIDEIRSFVVEGRTVEEPEPVVFADAVTDAWSTVQTGEAELQLEGELYLRADPDRLRRLLENLLGNAVEHGTPDGEPLGDGLTVRAVANEDGFSVEDDGVGFPEDARDRVFERGFTTSRDGTGFGLAIVRNIAEAHGWSVEAGASDHGGASVTISEVVLADDVLGQTIAD